MCVSVWINGWWPVKTSGTMMEIYEETKPSPAEWMYCGNAATSERRHHRCLYTFVRSCDVWAALIKTKGRQESWVQNLHYITHRIKKNTSSHYSASHYTLDTINTGYSLGLHSLSSRFHFKASIKSDERPLWASSRAGYSGRDQSDYNREAVYVKDKKTAIRINMTAAVQQQFSRRPRRWLDQKIHLKSLCGLTSLVQNPDLHLSSFSAQETVRTGAKLSEGLTFSEVRLVLVLV